MRIGILGCANIARQFVRDVADCPMVRVVAVARRHLETATEFAKPFGIARCHGSYEALLADSGVDCIYRPLTNSMHAEWAIRAAQAGNDAAPLRTDVRHDGGVVGRWPSALGLRAGRWQRHV